MTTVLISLFKNSNLTFVFSGLLILEVPDFLLGLYSIGLRLQRERNSFSLTSTFKQINLQGCTLDFIHESFKQKPGHDLKPGQTGKTIRLRNFSFRCLQQNPDNTKLTKMLLVPLFLFNAIHILPYIQA